MKAGDEVTFLWRGRVVSGTVTQYSRLIDAAFVKSPEVGSERIMVWGDSVLRDEEGIK